jgi:hypothetical protein
MHIEGILSSNNRRNLEEHNRLLEEGWDLRFPKDESLNSTKKSLRSPKDNISLSQSLKADKGNESPNSPPGNMSSKLVCFLLYYLLSLFIQIKSGK